MAEEKASLSGDLATSKKYKLIQLDIENVPARDGRYL
jgi:hypothetical protein